MEIEQIYQERYDSLINGNLSDFKQWLSTLGGEQTFLFIRWLQREGLII